MGWLSGCCLHTAEARVARQPRARLCCLSAEARPRRVAGQALVGQVAQRERRLLLLQLVHGCEGFPKPQGAPPAVPQLAARLQEGVLRPLLLQLPAAWQAAHVAHPRGTGQACT